jgi:23S rRNA pseudouridine1911/1915/1917 synthase
MAPRRSRRIAGAGERSGPARYTPGVVADSFRVEAGAAGVRLDVFLASSLGCSRAEARRVLARGAVRLDGRVLGLRRKGEPLREGAELVVADWTPPGARRPRAEPDLALAVLAEGPGWVVVDKPAGMPVHPYDEREGGCALNAVAAREPGIVGVGEGGLRSGVVHRLDVDTSGALAFATREDAWRRLRTAFRRGRMEKVYRALVVGEVADLPAVRACVEVAQRHPARVRVVPEGRVVELSVRLLERLRGATLVEVRPRTGFLHQIRAVLAHLGHPLLGDVRYGGPGPGEAAGAPRHMLHASRLAGAGLEAESGDPSDFADLLRRLHRAS